MSTKLMIALLVGMVLAVWGGVYYINAKNAKRVVYSVAERDARMKDVVQQMFPDQK